MNEPLISVIVPCYNVESSVELCLKSIVKQTYRNIEIICVNDGSTDNTEKILDRYQKEYNINVVKHDRNKGLYHARLSGIEVARGDYIAFVDSDDHISVDFYCSLVYKAMDEMSDITMCKIVHEKNGEYFVHNSYYNYEFPSMSGADVFNTYLEQEGLCFVWHTAWNKLYSRKIWEKALPYLKKQKDHLIMAEDVVFSSVLYYFAEKFTSSEYAWYYYVQNDGASTNISNATKKKFEKNICDLSIAFNFVEKFYTEMGISEDNLTHFYKWKKLYARFWVDNIKNSSLSVLDKNSMFHLLKKVMKIDKIVHSTESDNYFYKQTTKWDSRYCDLEDRLVGGNEKIVSFDLFDTVLLRPFYEPSDIFKIIEYRCKDYQSQISNYSMLRINSERILRKEKKYPNNEVTLDEIYDYMIEIYKVNPDIAKHYKELELNTEREFLHPRKSILNLIRMLNYIHKPVIIISDFYVGSDFIQSLVKPLKVDIDHIFVSCDYNKTKALGNLYDCVLDQLKIEKSELIHVGDSWDSDKVNAESKGLSTWFYAKAIDALLYRISDIPSSHLVDLINKELGFTERNSSAIDFLGMRCALAVVANHLYDNPYIIFNEHEEFGANLEYIGQVALGTYLLGICQWLADIDLSKNKLHFISRDGYLPMKAFEIYAEDNKNSIDYIHMSRKALLPLRIINKSDVFSISEDINYKNTTYGTVINALDPVIDGSSLDIDPAAIIGTEENFIKFMNSILNHYDQDKIDKYRNMMKDYFSNIFKKGDLVFDIGYSGRAQIILSKLLGYPISAKYIHSINGNNVNSLVKLNIDIDTYYQYTPNVIGGIREYVLSELAPSCIGYQKTEDGFVRPIFENKPISYCTKFVINRIQQSALGFIDTFVKHFKNELPILKVRQHDICIPFELFVNRSTEGDRHLFSVCSFEDELYYGSDSNLVKKWIDATHYFKIESMSDLLWRVNNVRPCSNQSIIDKINKHQLLKYVYYLIFDFDAVKRYLRSK